MRSAGNALRRLSVGEFVFGLILVAIVAGIVGLTVLFARTVDETFGNPFASSCPKDAQAFEDRLVSEPAFEEMSQRSEFEGGSVAHGCDEDDGMVWATITAPLASEDADEARSAALDGLTELGWRRGRSGCFIKTIGETRAYASVLIGGSGDSSALQLGVSNSRSLAFCWASEP